MPPTQRRRADAERNIATILDAARDLFARGANPSMSDIAAAAGVGRVTLYGHFPSRGALIEAVLDRAITDTAETFTAMNLDTDPADTALNRLIRTSWPILDRHRRLRTVAISELGPERLREHHAPALDHVERLIARGQDEHRFRTDLSLDWLVATCYAILHAAADEVDAGTLSSTAAPSVLTTTILGLLGAKPAD